MLDFLNIDPVAFSIPIGDGFDILWYGIIVTLGIAIGAYWAGREVEKRGGSADDFYNGLLIVIVAGFVFARGWYVVQEIIASRGTQFNSLGAIVNVRAGGLNILGGFVGALLVAYWWVKRKKLDFWLYADVAGPALLVAQSIGRWGNFINQELYGPPTDLPWGLLIEDSITSQSNEGKPGDQAVVYDRKDRFLAVGLYDPFSPIRVRLLAHNEPQPISPNWFRERLNQSIQVRGSFDDAVTSGFRLVHGENDGIPGLVLDKYSRVLVLKLYSAAWVPYLKDLLLNMLDLDSEVGTNQS